MSSSSFDKEVIMCPICRDVLIEPITLMCKHEMCKPCYEEYFEKADFRCPLCKKRLNSWARKATSKGTLVNKHKWKFLQENFSDLINRRQKGEENSEAFQVFQINLAKEGEIHKEYIEAKLQWEAEYKAQIDEQESASFELIQSILKEDLEEANKEKQKQIEQDQSLAKVVSEQLNQNISPRSVTKKLLRSTTSKKMKKPHCVNSIERYCVKRKLNDKENIHFDIVTNSGSSSQVKNNCSNSSKPLLSAKRRKIS